GRYAKHGFGHTSSLGLNSSILWNAKDLKSSGPAWSGLFKHDHVCVRIKTYRSHSGSTLVEPELVSYPEGSCFSLSGKPAGKGKCFTYGGGVGSTTKAVRGRQRTGVRPSSGAATWNER